MRKQNALFTFAYKAAGTIIFVVSMTSLFLDGGREASLVATQQVEGLPRQIKCSKGRLLVLGKNTGM